mgnify:CR=1 FL=1
MGTEYGRQTEFGRLWRERVGKSLMYLGIVLFVAFCLAPFLWIVSTSLKAPGQLHSKPPELISWPPFWKNYVDVFRGRPFALNIWNSVVVAGTATALSLVVGSFAAYALARLKFRGRDLILSMVLAVSMFPGIAIVSPLYLSFSRLGLVNTKMALILPYITFSMPLTIWTLTAFFRELPMELEEAAKVDGCTPIQAFTKVIVPLSAPGVFTCAILVFIFAWNEFLFARTFMNNARSYTVPVAMQLFEGVGDYTIPWGQIGAASVIVTLPLIVLVLLFQKRIVTGLTAGAVKG